MTGKPRSRTALDVRVHPVARQRDPRRVARRDQLHEQLAPISVRQPHVHQEQVEPLRRAPLACLGSAGGRLCRLLHEAGAELVVADVAEATVASAVEDYGATAVDPGVIHAQDVDVFAPCALGAVLNDATVPEIRARAVCGLANNQLAEPHDGLALHERGITYVPDYVVTRAG